MWSTSLAVLVLSAQGIQEPDLPSLPAGVAAARAAVDACLGGASDHAARGRAAVAIATAGRAAVHDLAMRIAAARAGADAVGRDGAEVLVALVPAVGVEVLRRELATGYVFAGQFDELRELMPEVGAFFAGLVVSPPEWLPEADVAIVLPVLRDVYASAPGDELRSRLRALAGDERIGAALQRSIACALAQWGEREIVDREREALAVRIAAGNGRDALAARSELAQLFYELREWARAATTQLDYLRTAEQHRRAMLRPLDYYNAACHLCLAGRAEEALRELERCVDLQRTAASRLRVDRKLFDRDPDLTVIRGTESFRELTRRAFDR
jgi:hypothetical protein